MKFNASLTPPGLCPRVGRTRDPRPQPPASRASGQNNPRAARSPSVPRVRLAGGCWTPLALRGYVGGFRGVLWKASHTTQGYFDMAQNPASFKNCPTMYAAGVSLPRPLLPLNTRVKWGGGRSRVNPWMRTSLTPRHTRLHEAHVKPRHPVSLQGEPPRARVHSPCYPAMPTGVPTLLPSASRGRGRSVSHTPALRGPSQTRPGIRCFTGAESAPWPEAPWSVACGHR